MKELGVKGGGSKYCVETRSRLRKTVKNPRKISGRRGLDAGQIS